MRLGAYPCVLQPRHAGPPRPTATTRSPSATATATSSTPTTAIALQAGGAGLLGHLARTGGWPRWSSCRTTPSSWPRQFHPEFKSKPFDPHPLFEAFVRAAVRTTPAAGPEGRRSDRGKPSARPWTPDAAPGMGGCAGRDALKTAPGAAIGALAQLARAPCSHRGGRWFESSTPHHIARESLWPGSSAG